jgi:signal transduction histidine kinase/CheY-like chemotaxis protein
MRYADVIDALDHPAALIDGDQMLASNAAFYAAGGEKAAALRPGERMETVTADGGRFVWKARLAVGGARLLTAEAGAVAAPATRERYLAALSHELRTPLNGVLGMAGLLSRTSLDAQQKAYVAALMDSGEHLLSLVNDVLDLAKLESGRLDLEPLPCDLEALLQGVAELLSPRAHQKGLEIAWAVDAGLPPVMADDGRLRQILFNLAGNAVKFTETGGVLIAVAGRQVGDALRLKFTVSDTGPGVPEADQARIFDEFARLEPQQRLEGAGLGLAIVRRLAQAHQGSVGLANRPEGGTDFWFEADFTAAGEPASTDLLVGVRVAVASDHPTVQDGARRKIEACGGEVRVFQTLAEAAASPDWDVLLVDHALRAKGRGLRPPADRPALVLLRPDERRSIARCRQAGFAGYLIKPLRRASLAERVLAVLNRAPADVPVVSDERVAEPGGLRLRILLAEDNPINALLARTHLEREGCSVHRAANGQEAVEAAESEVYDLILMDLRMPMMDGQQATRLLRARNVRTPIVALTADAFEDDRKACLAAGMDDFLTKPLESAALRRVLARWAGFTPTEAEAKLAS